MESTPSEGERRPLDSTQAAALHESIAAGDVNRAIDTRELAHLLGLAVITIQQQRARGDGPSFFRVGRAVRYRLGDVLAFRDAHTVGKPIAAKGSK